MIQIESDSTSNATDGRVVVGGRREIVRSIKAAETGGAGGDILGCND